MKLKIYIFLSGASAYLIYYITSLDNWYQSTGGIFCFVPIIVGILVGVYVLVRNMLKKYD
jgi:hypothetical protein